MQRIERYGVIALVLFLVTIVAVSFWDDGSTAPGPNDQIAKERHALRQNQRQVPAAKNQGKAGLNGRTLPATSGGGQLRQQPRKQPAGNARRNQSNIQFETVPNSVANQKKAESSKAVTFPDSLSEPDPRTQTKGNRTATNYDTIQERSQALAKRRQQEAAERDAALRAKQNAAGNAVDTQPVKRPGEAAISSASTYTVQPGDTLSEISFKTLGTSKRWREIQAINGNLDPSQLSVNMVLKLPAGAAAGNAAPSAVAFRKDSGRRAAPAASRGTYVVQKGDVLSRIAEVQLGGASRWREIAALNPSIDPNRLMEGAELRMPGSATPALASLTTTPRPTRKKNRVR